jgi:hypothetical protein
MVKQVAWVLQVTHHIEPIRGDGKGLDYFGIDFITDMDSTERLNQTPGILPVSRKAHPPLVYIMILNWAGWSKHFIPGRPPGPHSRVLIRKAGCEQPHEGSSLTPWRLGQLIDLKQRDAMTLFATMLCSASVCIYSLNRFVHKGISSLNAHIGWS